MFCLAMVPGKSFKESLKSLEADIQHANTLALDCPRDFDGACIQMRLSYSPVAQFFLFLVQWTDCSLAGALGLLRILIYKVYMDGTTTMSTYEWKASLQQFYAYVYPSLQQLEGGIIDTNYVKQRVVCMDRYKRLSDEESSYMSEIDLEREKECGICMETNAKVALPSCCHAMCMQCFRDWNSRSQSCPFCRMSLKRVNSTDLWILTDSTEVQDPLTLARDSLQRLFMYIEKLPLVMSDNVYAGYSAQIK
ncbi:hypothetical protein O6H91_08G045800 [Diphasiastrum complanatum]|uniref:Uncharacterized protein n=1 Tax=Diphasiastrum complanatum TaxID=34168 RepID=A0ACC2CX34_DIPCM|nr:hypothetical protein O6H91_08G045800 [Diphasiastrum complanatum]